MSKAFLAATEMQMSPPSCSWWYLLRTISGEKASQSVTYPDEAGDPRSNSPPGLAGIAPLFRVTAPLLNLGEALPPARWMRSNDSSRGSSCSRSSPCST